MGGGPRPWLGNPIPVTVTTVGDGRIVLTFDQQEYPAKDIKAGHEYLVVFNSSGSGSPGTVDKPKT